MLNLTASLEEPQPVNHSHCSVSVSGNIESWIKCSRILMMTAVSLFTLGTWYMESCVFLIFKTFLTLLTHLQCHCEWLHPLAVATLLTLWPRSLQSVFTDFFQNILLNMDTHGLLWTILLLHLVALMELATTNGLNLPDGQRTTYSRDSLLQLGLFPQQAIITDAFPEEIRHKNSSHCGNSTHHKHKVTRRGKRKSGTTARLKRETCTQRLLPSIILANVRSLHNKLDELQANINHLHKYRSASILAFTETWLNKNDSDSSLYILMALPPLLDWTLTVSSLVNNMVGVCQVVCL